MLSIVFSLAITLCVETFVYMFLKPRDLKLFLIVSGLNIVLNVTMNVVLIYAIKDQTIYWIILISYELLTTCIEAFVITILMKFRFLAVLLFAFIANLSSFLIGLGLAPVNDHLVALIVLIIVFFLGYLAIYLSVLFKTIKDNRAKNSLE
jgi:hypothetical protein